MINMYKEITKKEIVNYLFAESNDPIMSDIYSKGFFVNLASLIKKFFKKNARIRMETVQKNEKENICVCFFDGEYRGVKGLLKYVNITTIDRYHVDSLGVVINAIGVREAIFQAVLFIVQSLKWEGGRSIRCFANPTAAYLYYLYFIKTIDKDGTDSFVITNGISPYSNAIYFAAKKMGLKCIYLEHSVTPKPVVMKLLPYDECVINYSFTEDLIKSKNKLIHNIVVINQMIEYLPEKKNKYNNVGVCVNESDDITFMLSLAKELVRYKINVDFRFKGSDRRVLKYQKEILEMEVVTVSFSNDLDIDEYIDSKDVIIVGTSSVLSVCVQMNKYAIYFFNGEEDKYDLYGLVDYFCIPHAANAEECLSMLYIKI